MAEIIRAEGQSQDIEIWARGVDSALFSPLKRDMAWRRQQGIGDDEIAICFAGRLVKEKNTAVFVRVLKALLGRGLKVRPLVIGDGPEMGAMRAALPEAAFVGFLHGDDLARAYASADIFFFPSESETFGNVTLEAMASGLPVVNALSSGSNSLVLEGATGFLASARDEALLADRLALLANDQALRSRMGNAGRQRALQFSWDAILSGLVESYRRVLKEAQATAWRLKVQLRSCGY